MRGDASRASAIQSLEKAGSNWFTARNALPNSGRRQHLDRRFCKQTNGTNLEDPIGPTWKTPWTNLEDPIGPTWKTAWTNLEESRGFFRWLGLFKEQSHSTARAPAPAVPFPFLCKLGVFFWSQGNFFRGDPSVFFGEMFSRKFCLSKSDRNGKGLTLKRLVVKVLWIPPKRNSPFFYGIPEGNSFGNA